MGSIADINVTGKFLDSFEDKYGPVARSLGRLIRPTIVADEGKTFVWCDWSAIEARVLPWLADSPGAERVLDIFRENDKDPGAPDIYMIEASHVYGCDPAKIDKQQRQLGKVAVLSLGFGGSHGALTAMATNYGIHLSGSQREEVINTWRDNNKWARRFWGWFNDQSDYCGLWGAFNMAMLYPGEIFEAGRVAYVYEKGYLGGTVFCSLPDGRLLTYPDVKVRKLERELDNGEKEDYTALSYRRGYGYSGLWYGKLAENVTQAYAASKLRRALVRLDAPMYSEWMPVVAHTHDEIVTMPSDVRADDAEQRLMEVMLRSEDWDEDLPLAAEASRYEYYSKAA